MKGAEFQAIYIMWLRQMKRFIRARSRVVASIVQPLFFLFIFGFGFNQASFAVLEEGDYIQFLTPGIVTMGIMFSSMFAGISVLWDKQFGFLQEVLVAPISRISIIIGRTLGGATVALIQGVIILLIALIMGVHISGTVGLIFTLFFMILIAFTAVGFGLVIASKMEDFQGFQLIMSLVIMPLLFLSSAFFPVTSNPTMKTIALFNPLFYMVDGLRGSLIVGVETVNSPLFNLVIVVIICIFMMSLGSYLFSKMQS